MHSISLILPIRSLDAASFSPLARFVREFVEGLNADTHAGDRSQSLRVADEPRRAGIRCEVLVPAARISRIKQSPDAPYSFRQWRVTNWRLEDALQQAIAEAEAPVVACCSPSTLPDAERFSEMCTRLARADFVAGRRRTSAASKLLMTATQLPRRAVMGVQRRDPDFLCWVALREAVADLRWRPGGHRYLAEMVAARGFRVAEFRVTDQPAFIPPVLSPPHRVVRNLLAAWKLGRKTEQANAERTGTARQPNSANQADSANQANTSQTINAEQSQSVMREQSTSADEGTNRRRAA